MTKILHSGDLGDLVYLLPALRTIGNVELWLDDRPYTARLLGPRFDAIKPLLEAQPYITAVHAGTPDGAFIDASTFRNGGHPFGERLTDLQAAWLKVSISHDPWISVTPDEKFTGRVVVHRSPRYGNPYFPWNKVADFYGERMVAIGGPEEARDLSTTCGKNIEYCSTKNFLELAQMIAGADLFIGNQSSPCAVAVGLGAPYLQETCVWTPDCMFPERSESWHSFDGEIPGIAEPWQPLPEVEENVTPPGGWQWNNGGSSGRHLILGYAVRESQMPKAEVLAQNIARLPNYFFRQSRESIFGAVQNKMLELRARCA